MLFLQSRLVNFLIVWKPDKFSNCEWLVPFEDCTHYRDKMAQTGPVFKPWLEYVPTIWLEDTNRPLDIRFSNVGVLDFCDLKMVVENWSSFQMVKLVETILL
jgi:hypothetical protein